MKFFFQTHILRQASYIIMTFNQTLNVKNILAYTFFYFFYFYNYNYIIIIYHIYIALFFIPYQTFKSALQFIHSYSCIHSYDTQVYTLQASKQNL